MIAAYDSNRRLFFWRKTMGTYATITSLGTLMPDITFNSATDDLATECIRWAENEVNKHLAKRYDVSVWLATSTAVPPEITSLTETLSQGYLHDQMSRGSTESQSRADRLIKRAMSNLEKLRDGLAELVDSSGDIIEDRTSRIYVISNTTSYSRTFNEDNPLKWKIDKDKLDDIKSDRS
jgi:hypothetical protein